MHRPKMIRYVLLPILIFLLGCAGGRKYRENEIRSVLSSSAGYYLQKGALALGAQHYAEALHFFRQAEALTPFDAAVHNNLGVAFYHLGQADSAIHACQTAVRLQPDYAQAYVNLAKAHLALGRFQDAHSAAEQALLYHPQKAQPYALQAEIYENEGDWESAVNALQRAVDCEPNHVDWRNNLGTLLFRSGETDLAIAAYQQALQRDSTHVVTMFNLGNALARKCLLQEAMSRYEEVVRYDPDFTPAYNNYGLILLFLRRPHEAVDAFRRALQTDADAAIVMYNLSIALTEMDSLLQSLSYIRQAVDLQPSTANYFLQLGRVLDRMGEKESAVGAFHQALALDSTLATGYNELANALAEDELHQAQLAYNRALALYPDYLQKRYLHIDQYFTGGFVDLLVNCGSATRISNDYAMIYNNLGKVYFRMNRFAEALKAFNSAIAIQPNLWEPLENKAVIYFAQNNHDKGREMLSAARLNRARAAAATDSLPAALTFCLEAINLYPHHPGAYALMADIYTALNSPEEAEASLRKGLRVGKDDYDIHLAYGRFLNHRARYQEAEIHLQKALTIKPDDGAVHYALAVNYYFRGEPASAKLHAGKAAAAGVMLREAFIRALVEQAPTSTDKE